MTPKRSLLRADPATTRRRTDERSQLVCLRPRFDAIHVSQGRTVFALDRDGSVLEGAHGLFVHQTRLLSRYRYLVNGRPPHPVALSNVEQHSWLGYYIHCAPGAEVHEPDRGSGHFQQLTQQTLELRLARYVSEAVHEDVDLVNFSQQATSFELTLEIDADFADQAYTSDERQPFGEIRREWHELRDGVSDLRWDVAEQKFDQQEYATLRADTGTAPRGEPS